MEAIKKMLPFGDLIWRVVHTLDEQKTNQPQFVDNTYEFK
jgi:hypothetical protein